MRILTGATFFGAGGGGPVQPAVDMLDRLETERGYSLEINLLDIDEIGPEEYAAMAAGLGSPLALIGKEFGPDSVRAFRVFQKALAMEGKTVSFLYSGELGGFNTFVHMLVSILSDRDPSKRIPLLDVDGNGRAVPELNTSLNSVRGFPPRPIGMGTLSGDEIILYPTDDASAERMARALCQTSGMQIGFSTWGMRREELRLNAVCGALTACERAGALLEEACVQQVPPSERLRESMDCRTIISGVVETVGIEMVDGFDVGQSRIRGDNGEAVTLAFQNENLFAMDAAGRVLVNAPDLICVVGMEADCYRPLTNADIAEGMRVEVIAVPAHPLWWAEDKKAYRCWEPALKRAGFTGEMKRMKRMDEING
ncbi:MAG: DUF917 domain-containing protein [Bacillota bacterium]